ncbi:MAG TPA: DUF393 domain-containing protein [Candidatus Acidoferrum sp.]|nr:DUF393 domain-containing protein [Candidatus Acidoferrum sp.]
MYDDQCDICVTGVDKIRSLDRYGLIEFVPLSHPKLPARITLPPAQQMHDEIHLFDPSGHAYKGADAVMMLAGLLPSTRPMSRFLSWPVVRNIAKPLYRLVARNRTRIGGKRQISQQ